jgi:hypothetical protein
MGEPFKYLHQKQLYEWSDSDRKRALNQNPSQISLWKRDPNQSISVQTATPIAKWTAANKPSIKATARIHSAGAT